MASQTPETIRRHFVLLSIEETESG